MPIFHIHRNWFSEYFKNNCISQDLPFMQRKWMERTIINTDLYLVEKYLYLESWVVHISHEIDM